MSDGVEKGRGCEVAGRSGGDGEAACRAKAGLIYNSIDLLQQIVKTFDYLDQHNNNKQIKRALHPLLKTRIGYRICLNMVLYSTVKPTCEAKLEIKDGYFSHRAQPTSA